MLLSYQTFQHMPRMHTYYDLIPFVSSRNTLNLLIIDKFMAEYLKQNRNFCLNIFQNAALLFVVSRIIVVTDHVRSELNELD